MNDLSTAAIENDECAAAEDRSAVGIGDDYEAFKKFLAEEDDEPLPSMATTGGGVAFSNRHCKTEEEADALLEAFLREELGLTDEDD